MLAIKDGLKVFILQKPKYEIILIEYIFKNNII